jgi:hypothetical protein
MLGPSCEPLWSVRHTWPTKLLGRRKSPMRVAFACLLLATIGCSAGDPPDTEDGSGATGGTGASSGGGAGTSSGGSSGKGQGTGGTNVSGSGGSAGSGMMKPPPKGVGIDVFTKCTDPNQVGPTPIRRLSRLEYFNSVRDLFGVQVNQGDLPADELLGVFTTNLTPMTSDTFTRYDTSAKGVGAQVAANIAQLSNCGATDSACIQGYLLGKARQAFHGSLDASDPDRQRLTDLYTTVAGEDVPLAITTAVRFMLSSPRFLYTIEFGTPEGNVARLTPGELAGRLASFLWRSVPDQALLEAADGGMLATDAGIRTQTTRMVADAKAQPVLRSFANEWLGIKSSVSSAPVDAAIVGEIGDVFATSAQGAGTYPELFTSLQSRGTAELASFYGTTLSGDGSMTLPAERRGLLLRAGFLRSHIRGNQGSPTHRGKQVRQALLCDPVEAPGNVNMDLPDDPNLDPNDIINAHSADPKCSGCHSLMDPIGAAFGDYGPDGRFDQSLAASTAGAIEPGGVNQLTAEFTNVDGLLDVLGNDENPQQCFVIQMNRFALGRGETLADACGLKEVWEGFKANGLSLNSLLVEVASSYMIQVRNVVKAGEACQ